MGKGGRSKLWTPIMMMKLLQAFVNEVGVADGTTSGRGLLRDNSSRIAIGNFK
jgi:hypothetical protein